MFSGAMEKEIGKEISERIATLTRRLQALQSLYNAAEGEEEQEERGIEIITLGGNNEGATMNVQGNSSNDSEEKLMAGTQGESAKELVNSNVQSVNNSIMFESSSEQRDPGVHLNVQSFSEGGELHRNRSKANRSRSRAAGLAKDEEWGTRSSNPMGLHANCSRPGKAVWGFLSGSSDED